MEPRHAASLLVTRGRGPAAEVLLGRRPAHDRFMPSVWVFPGGRVDPGDEAVEAALELQPEVEGWLTRRATARTARALAIAAVRETWEETGLALGDVHGGRLRPDLSRLDYLGRAITPAGNPIRYHARFFHAEAQHAQGRLRGNGELLELDWWRIDDALGLAIIDVTERVLEELRHKLAGGPRRTRPFIHYRRTRQLVTREG